MTNVINSFLTVCMSIIVVLMLLCLYRAVRGPRFTDRIAMGGAISTMVITLIVLIAVKLNEGYLLDVAALYSMLGFLSVAVICRIAAFRVYGKKLHEGETDEVEELNHD